MNRRKFLKVGVAGMATATTLSSTAGSQKEAAADSSVDKKQHSAAPCGLFCEACSEWLKGSCHGCGCECGHCIASSHSPNCAIYGCVMKKAVEYCAECREFACSQLIMHACDPVWRTHAPCLENLRRRKAVGTNKWIAEQRAYWADADRLRKQHFIEEQCQETIRALQKSGYKKPY